MNTLLIGWRNIFRHRRRSLTTVLAIVVSAIAVILFGGFVSAIVVSMHSDTVRTFGHLQVFKTGYFEFGPAKPGSYGIADYDRIIALIKDDEVLRPLVRVVTPLQSVSGVAGNFAENASKTFFGLGIVPSDRERMRSWDDLHFGYGYIPPLALADDDRDGGVIGVGLARMLHLCGALAVPNCHDGPSEAPSAQIAGVPAEDFSGLIEHDTQAAAVDRRPKLDLLAATANGAPNVVSVRVVKAQRDGVREIDDNYVLIHLSLAQRLLYGRDQPKVTGIVVQLFHSGDLAAARARLAALFAGHGLDLEIRPFTELNPMYVQVMGMFAAIFGFIAAIMGVIVLFTVVNTMTMSVLERVSEIGTLRALGLRRSGIRALFLAEGLILGTLSATLGVVVAMLAAALVNRANLTWSPPTYVEPVPLLLLVWGNTTLIGACWLGLVLLAILSSLLPAIKAARLEVVDALRHV